MKDHGSHVSEKGSVEQVMKDHGSHVSDKG